MLLGTKVAALTLLFNIANPNSVEIERLLNKRTDRGSQTTISLVAANQENNFSLEGRLLLAQNVQIQERGYKVIFPFEEPSTSDEGSLLKELGPVEYMNRIRSKVDVDWAISLGRLINQIPNPLNWTDFYKSNSKLGDLLPFVPREDMMAYQESRPSFQGTYVPAQPTFFQRTQTGEFIPVKISGNKVIATKDKIDYSEEFGDMLNEMHRVNKEFKALNKIFDGTASDIILSNDGSRVAFVGNIFRIGDEGPENFRGSQYEVYIANAGGTNIRRISRNVIKDFSPGWSKDDTKMAYFSVINRGENIDDIIKMTIVDLSDGSEEVITLKHPELTSMRPVFTPKYLKKTGKRQEYGKIYRNFFAPGFSPSGKEIAFYTLVSEGEKEIYILDLKSRKLRKLLELDFSPDWYRPLAWSDDGRSLIVADSHKKKKYQEIVVYRDAPKDSPDLKIMPIPADKQPVRWAEQGIRNIIGPLVESIFGESIEPKYQLVFSSKTNGNLEILLWDGTEKINLTNNPAKDYSPVVSPDGMRIAFVSDRDGSPEVYVMDIDGSNPKRVTDSRYVKGNVRSITFSRISHLEWLDPDSFVFSGEFGRLGKSIVFVKELDDDLKVLGPYSDRDFLMSASPDGKRLVMSVNNKLYTLSTTSTRGSLISEPLRVKGMYPQWSPDGTKFVYSGVAKGKLGLYTMDWSSRNIETLLERGDEFFLNPVWSPDGGEIAYIRSTKEKLELYKINSDGSNNRKITDFPIIPSGFLEVLKMQWLPGGYISVLYPDLNLNRNTINLVKIKDGTKTQIMPENNYSGFSWMVKK